MAALEPFKDHDIAGCKIIITKAGDGLSEALGLKPVSFDFGDDVYAIWHGKIGKIGFVPLKDNPDFLDIVYTAPTEEIAMVTEAEVRQLLDGHMARVRAAKEAAGEVTMHLPGTLPNTDEAHHLAVHHESGMHASGLVEGCGYCDQEAEAAAEENDGFEYPTPDGPGQQSDADRLEADFLAATGLPNTPSGEEVGSEPVGGTVHDMGSAKPRRSRAK